MEEIFVNALDREKYLKTCIENDLNGWKKFISDMKVKENQYQEYIEIKPEDDVILNNRFKVPKFGE